MFSLSPFLCISTTLALAISSGISPLIHHSLSFWSKCSLFVPSNSFMDSVVNLFVNPIANPLVNYFVNSFVIHFVNPL